MPNIDERVVQMTFDNRQFEAGVSESLKTLDDLKKALNFDEVEGSLKNIENAFNNLNLSGLADSVDFIASRFEPLGKIADKVLDGIAGKVVDTGKKVADTFFGLTDMNSGFDKYATRTKAVQTIMNATGKSLEEVEEVLDKLQEYTDETSYDFATMVETIGKFTSVGVDLKAAEIAMEGIGNEAAESGASIQQANHAMYNFAQALSQGSVKLQDWKSIATANMSTKKFKETLIDTAVELGVLEKKGEGIGSIVTTNQKQLEAGEAALKKANKATKDRAEKVAAAQKKISDATKETTVDFKSFEYTLQDGWLTTDVLIKSLEKYANDQSAYEAAQKALTFGDAIQSVKDALSSGWMESFNYIFGNLEEAKKLWTDVSNALYEYIAIFSNWRNKILESWHTMGGYNDMIEAATNLWQTFMNIVKGVGEALTNVFPILKPENMTQALLDGTKALKDWSAGLLEMFGLQEKVNKEEEETAEKAEEIANKTDEITDSTKEAAQAMSGLSEATKTTANNLGSVKTGLKRGMRGKEVKELQKQLMKFGFRLDKYGADGIFGPETQAALKALQLEIGVAETGIMDKATKAALQTDEALQKLQEHAKKGITIGSRGNDVKKLQKELNKYLKDSEKLAVDGIFGPKTEAAIKKLQKQLNIAQTGVWDEATKNAVKNKKVLLMNIDAMSKSLKVGMKGEDVKKFQQELIKGGYLDEGMADGVYGPKTQEAVKKLQKALGIKETGNWDKATWIALYNSQQMSRYADTTAKANKKASDAAKKAADDNKKAAENADKATEHTTVAMMRLQNIVKGWAAALKIASKFAGAIAEIAGNILGMFAPLVDVVIRFGSELGIMFENLAKDLDKNDVYGSFVKKVTEAFGPLGKFIQNVADGLNTFLDAYDAFLEATGKNNTFGSFFGFLSDYLKKIPAIGFIIDIFETVKSIVGPIISFLIDEMKKLIGWFGSDEFKQAKDSVFSWISEKLTTLREAIAKFKEDHPELTIENFIAKIKEIGGWLGGKFGEGFDFIKDKFTEFKAVIDKFKEDHPELTISNIFQKIKDVFDSIRKMFSNFFSGGEEGEGGSFFDNLKERFKAFEPVLTWLEGIKDRIVKLWQSIFGGGEETSATTTKTTKSTKPSDSPMVKTMEVVEEKLSLFDRVVDWFIGVKDKLVAAWNDLLGINKGEDLEVPTAGGFVSVADKLKDFGKWILDNWPAISLAVIGVGASYALVSAIQIARNLGKGFKDLGGALKGLFGKEDPKDTLGNTALKIGGAIMIVALAVGLLSLIDADKAAKGFEQFIKVLGSMVAAVIAIKEAGGESDGAKQALMLAASVGIIAAAIWLLCKTITGNDPGVIMVAIGIIAAAVWGLGKIAIEIAKSSKHGETSTKGFLAMCAGVLVLVIAFGKLMKILNKYWSNGWQIVVAVVIIGAMVWGLGKIAIELSKNSAHDKTSVKGFLSMCAGVYVLVRAFGRMMAILDKYWDNGWQIAAAVVIIGAMVAGLGKIAIELSKSSIMGEVKLKGFLSLCGGVYVLVLAFERALNATSGHSFFQVLGAVAIVELMIFTLSEISKKMNGISAGKGVGNLLTFLALAGAVWILAQVFEKIVNIMAQNNKGVVWGALAAIEVLLITLGVIAVKMSEASGGKALLGGLGNAITFISLAYLLRTVVSTIGDVLVKIKDVNPEVLKWFFIGIDAAIGILAGLVLAFSKIPIKSMLSADVGLLAFIGVLAAAMEMIGSVAADLIEKFSYAIGTLGRCLGHFAEDTANLDYNKLRAVVKFVKDDLPELIKAIIDSNAKGAEQNGYSIRRLGIVIEDFGKYISTITSKTVASANNAIELMKKTKNIAGVLDTIVFPFGKELAMTFFGSSLVRYGNSLKDVDTTKLSDVNRMIGDSLELTKKVNEATWISSATTSLSNLGSAIAMYYNALNEVKVDENGDAIEPKNLNTTGMAQYISELVNSFNEDDIAQLMTFQENGKNDMYQAGYGITALANALDIYADKIGGLSGKETEIELANGIIDKVKSINDSYDEESMKGFYNAYTGELFNGTELVSTNIVSLAGALKTYSEKISDINPTNVDTANKVIDKVLEVEAYVDKKKEVGKIVDDLSKSLTLPKEFSVDDFALDIESIAKALGTYAEEISGLSYFQILKANAVLNKVMSLEGSMPLQPGFFVELLYDVDDLRSFADGLGALGGALATYWDKIKDVQFNDSKQESANKILDAVADIAVKLSRGGNWISQARGGVPSIKGLTDGLTQIATDLVTFGSTVKGLDTSKTTEAVALLSGLIDAVSKVSWDDLMHGTGLFGANKVSKFAEVGSGINDFLTNMTSSLDTELKSTDGTTKTKLESAGQTIINTLSSGVTNANIESLQSSIFSAIDTSTFYASLSMVTTMNTLGTDLLSWIETGLKDETAIGGITGTMESLIGKIKTVLTSNWEAFKAMGQFIDLGIAAGLGESQSLVTKKAEEVAWAAYLAACKKLGIKSPSREFMYVGEMMDEGLAKGISNHSYSITDVGQKTLDEYRAVWGDAVLDWDEVVKPPEPPKKNFWSGIVDWGKNAAKDIDGFMSGISRSFTRSAFNISADLGIISSNVTDKINNELNNDANTKVDLSGFGQNVLDGITGGITKANAEELPSAIDDAIQNGISGLTSGDVPGMTEVGEKMIASVENGMKDETSSSAITTAIDQLLGGIKTAFTNSWESFKGIGKFINLGISIGLSESASTVTAKAEEVAWAAYLAACKKLGIASPSKEFIWVGEMIDEGLAKGLNDNVWSIEDAGSGIEEKLKEIWGDLYVDPTTFTTIGDGMANAAKANESAIGQFVENAGSTISDGFEKIKTVAGTTAELFKNNNFFDIMLGGLDSQKIVDAYMRQSGAIENAVKTVTSNAAEAGSKASSNSLADAGKNILGNFAAGLMDPSKRGTIISGMNTLMTLVSNATKNDNNQEQFRSVGKYMDTGMELGLKAGSNNVTLMAARVAWDAYVAAKNVLGIASPSKEFLWLGEMVDKGLVLGLKTYAHSVSTAAGEVADGAIDTATKGVMALIDVIGFGDIDQPVIRPVLDLSDIQAGIKTMPAMFGKTTIAPTRSADMAGFIATRRKAVQDSVTTKADENSVREISEAIQKMTEDMNGMTDEIKNMKIYMDGNTLVGYVSPRVNKNLGLKATLAGRMN